jgi:hypothetical protein
MLVGKTVLITAAAVMLIVVVVVMRKDYNTPRVAAGIDTKAASKWSVLASNATTCKNTVQGQTFLTDERGMLKTILIVFI